LFAALVALVPAYAQTSGDADGDGLPDAWEIQNRLNPNNAGGIHGAGGDPDRDGLPNGDEFANLTNPRRADTDGDGLNDLWEVENLVNPLSATGDNGADGDPDLDGLINKDEMARGADPYNWDSDNDVLPDGWEVVEGIKPNDNRGRNGPRGDANGDGESNLDRFYRFNEDFEHPAPRGRRGR
jgi:hypothetical protein